MKDKPGSKTDLIRRRFLVGGIVQGVGFRPYIFNLAESEELTGFVSNTSAGVLIEIQGVPSNVNGFFKRLKLEAPALSKIVSVESDEISLVENCTDFTIEISQNTPGTNTLIPADMATCEDCLKDVFTPGNRRYGYAFTNCTNCGPRWTIIDRIPYDRPFTSMAPFTMCAACQAEYENPRDRRFHAQPNACPECGPQVWLEIDGERKEEPGVLAAVAKLLSDGKILAIKGLGGFHLAVDASNEEAVQRLRQRKNREAKPLAVMAPNLKAVSEIVFLDDQQSTQLLSPQAPILLLDKLAETPLAPSVAPGHQKLGVMLPYTPLHHLLFRELNNYSIKSLIMTSGNSSDEPICLNNQEARNRLSPIADAFVFHNRDILRRADDSVLQVLNGKPHFFRRSRGFSPVPVFVSGNGIDVLAVGPELKNTICILKNDRAFLSPHIGDLENLQAYEFFEETLGTLQNVLECEPDVIAHDMHPGYFSSQWAQKQKAQGKTLIPVQHHHAHMVAVMAEHQLSDPAIGLIMDGTGLGEDGTIWGGEILFGDASGYERLGHFDPMPIPGGDAAIKAPWRTAVSYLRSAVGEENVAAHLPDSYSELPVNAVLEMLQKNINSPLTSSCGRLFDAVAALTGRWPLAEYEAQAAIELMALTNHKEVQSAQPWPLPECPPSLVLPVGSLVIATARDVSKGVSAEIVSARFHRSLIELLAQAAYLAAKQKNISQVVLSGGVFQNEILLAGLVHALEDRNLKVFRPIQTPANDGAICLGQAIIARTRCGL
ncbi:MAG: carbamoyltransferase HypF [bacterium]|nr:carbamoyltransferase HypF [bacterium]